MKYVFVKVHNNSVYTVSVHDSEDEAYSALSKSFELQTGRKPSEQEHEFEFQMKGEITIDEDPDNFYCFSVTPCE